MCFFMSLGAIAQQADTAFNRRPTLQITAFTDSIALGSYPVVTESIRFTDSLGNQVFPKYKFKGGSHGWIVFLEPVLQDLNLEYLRLQLDLVSERKHKDTNLIIPLQNVNTQQLEQNLYSNSSNRFTPFRGLSSQGSISRGITVGNNQNAVVSSDLNLQLSGNISDNTILRASITDNSIPVQTDGYTQQLNEFDRVYLELENESFGLIRAGDYNIESLDNYFLRFQKRISGAGVLSEVNLKDASIPIQAQAGIARGKFARNRFQGQEGNQGPYKLQGANGEQFIIIISGSERVYIDGILQKRGQQYDYVMDYNAGEISFTALQPITKDKRIVVEFQYTEQNYLRSVVYGQSGFRSANWQTNIHFFNEQDSKNNQLTGEFSEEERAILANVGDQLNKASISTIKAAEYIANQVFYSLVDTLGYDSVLVFSLDTSSQLYSASFTLVGQGKGNYVLDQSLVNGQVFKWVEPVNGIPQGNYEPIRSLAAPNALQVLSFQTKGQIGENQNLAVDFALSNNDINLFSDLDEQNDLGSAGKLEYGLNIPIRENSLKATLGYEYNTQNFQTLERVRRVEFARDWNLPFNYNNEIQLGNAALAYEADSVKALYNFEFLQAKGTNGQRHSTTVFKQGKKQEFNWSASALFSEDTARLSTFLRENGAYRVHLLPKFWMGLRSIGEWNLQNNLLSDSLFDNSYSFLEYTIFTGWGDTTASFTEIGFTQRFDDTASQGSLKNFAIANTYYINGQLKTKFNGRFNYSVNTRNLQRLQNDLPDQNTVTTRVNYLQKLFSNTVVSNSFYETGAGTEPRRNFSYIEVASGTGVYTHTDYNNNGIQELDEFEIAPAQDLADYVRVFTVTNDFVRTNLIKLGQNLSINTPYKWQQSEGLKKGLSRFSIQFNYQLDRKTLLTGNTNVLNPFETPEADSLIVGLNNNFRNTLFFNRSKSAFGADYTHRRASNRSLLSFGVEGRFVQENTLNLRLSLGENFIFRIKGLAANKENRSENYPSRNYDIQQYENRYALSYQPSRAFILTISHEVGSEESESEIGDNLLVSQNSGLELNYNLAESLAMLVQANYIFNGFKGEQNSPSAYELLQALQPGNNATLTVTVQRTFLKNIVLSFNYGGRFSADNPSIHTGSVQVKAFL